MVALKPAPDKARGLFCRPQHRFRPRHLVAHKGLDKTGHDNIDLNAICGDANSIKVAAEMFSLVIFRNVIPNPLEYDMDAAREPHSIISYEGGDAADAAQTK